MARDGSGTYSLPATMAVANATASSTTVNSIMDDVATALTDSINKDGTKAFAANQSMGGNKITSLGAATALTDAAQLSQVQKGNVQQASTVGGTADAITLAFTPTITSYTTGMVIRWVSGGANTVTGPTINVDSLGAKTVKKNPGAAALAVGDLGISGTINEAVYNGTDFILLTLPATAISAASDSASGIVELATTTETLTGTDTARAVTPDALASLWEQGADIASAGTITVGEGGYFVVTGTTTITDIDPGTDKAGREFDLRFSGALTLTHNATTLILPTGANITTAAGDVARFRSEGSDVVRCVGYMRASGAPLASSGGYTLLGTLSPSGSEVSLTGLTLTSYKFLRIYFAATGGNDCVISAASGVNEVTCFTKDKVGWIDIDLTTGFFVSFIADTTANTSSTTLSSYNGDCAVTSASTAIYFGGEFNVHQTGGTIKIYGVS